MKPRLLAPNHCRLNQLCVLVRGKIAILDIGPLPAVGGMGDFESLKLQEPLLDVEEDGLDDRL